MASRLMDMVLTHARQGSIKNILEVGCGTGRLTRLLATAFPSANITAIDISAAMVAKAKSTLAGVDFIRADAEEYENSTHTAYDLIISNATAQWFEDAEATITKFKSWLSSEGVIAIGTFGELTFWELREAFNAAYQAHGDPAGKHVKNLLPVSAWRGFFPHGHVDEKIIVQKFPSVRDFLKSIQQTGATQSTAAGKHIARTILARMMAYYAANFHAPATDEVQASYHVVCILSKL